MGGFDGEILILKIFHRYDIIKENEKKNVVNNCRFYFGMPREPS